MDKEFQYNYGDCYKNDKFVRMRFEIVKNLLSQYLKNGVNVLDIGCYDGSMLEVLKKDLRSISYTGLDADETALEIALLRGAKTMKVNFEHDDLPFKEEEFDIIIIGEVLEHLRNPARLIKQTQGLLKPEGVIVISLPNECTIYHRLKMLFGKGIDGTGFETGYHLHFPTLKQGRVFIGNYFKIIEQKYWYHLGVGGFFEKMLSIIPHCFMQAIVNLIPTLFARGGIYLCKK
jgi:SAM-dependent methyltransferase